MLAITGDTFAEVYEHLLEQLLDDAEYESAPRGLAIKEHTNVMFQIQNPESCLYENERRSSQLKYIAAELLWYYNADPNTTDFITKYAKFWNHIKNGDGTVNSMYGNLIFNEINEHGISEWQWAYDILCKDKDTRGATLRFNKPAHSFVGNKDFVCTMYATFHIRNNKLNLSVKMRSNDAILGTPTDVAFFCSLQSEMLFHLRTKYSDLELGTYTHVVDSFHIYERHFDLVEEMLQRKFTPANLPQSDDRFNFVESDGSVTDMLYAMYHATDLYGDLDSLILEKPANELYDFIKTNIK